MLTRAPYPVVVATATVLAAIASPLTVIVYRALRAVPAGVDPMAGVATSALLAAVVAALAAPLALAVGRRARVDEAERVDW